MTSRSVEIHPLAVRELRAARRWYARRNPAAARRFSLAFKRVVQRITAAAEQGSPYKRHYRWMTLHRFPYVVYYEIRDPRPVLIYSIAHARRRPGYWRWRTRP
jgi:plasmid stabilization system protein ParE